MLRFAFIFMPRCKKDYHDFLNADLRIKTNINVEHSQIRSHNSLNGTVSQYGIVSGVFEIKMLL